MVDVNPGVTDLEAWWDLNEESGNRADAHGANTLIDNNTVLFGAGVQGNAADFESGNDESLSIADNASLSMGAGVDMTIGCWAKPESSAGFGELMSKFSATAANQEYDMFHDAANEVTFRVAQAGGGKTLIKSTDTITDAAWNFAVAWYDGANIFIQVNNGTPVSVAFSADIQDDNGNFRLGRNDAGSPFDGLIDVPFVYKRALSADERSWLYNGGSGRAYSDLIATFIPKVGGIF